MQSKNYSQIRRIFCRGTRFRQNFFSVHFLRRFLCGQRAPLRIPAHFFITCRTLNSRFSVRKPPVRSLAVGSAMVYDRSSFVLGGLCGSFYPPCAGFPCRCFCGNSCRGYLNFHGNAFLFSQFFAGRFHQNLCKIAMLPGRNTPFSSTFARHKPV